MQQAYEVSAQRAEGAGVQTLPIVGGKANLPGLGREGLPVFERSEKQASTDGGGLWPTPFPACLSEFKTALALSSEWGPACGVERVSAANAIRLCFSPWGEQPWNKV